MSFTWSPSVAMSRDEMDRFLQQKLVARLTSIPPDGYPHTIPSGMSGMAKPSGLRSARGHAPGNTSATSSATRNCAS
jgi:hypothetical protein